MTYYQRQARRAYAQQPATGRPHWWEPCVYFAMLCLGGLVLGVCVVLWVIFHALLREL